MSQFRILGTLRGVLAALAFSWAMAGTHAARAQTPRPRTYSLPPAGDVQYRLQGRLIEAVPGDVIQLEEGIYHLRRQLDAASDHLTLRGRGSQKTILSFAGQEDGGQGIEATGNNFTIEGLTVEDTAGNAIKVLGARGVVLRDVRVRWTGGPKTANGAYGLYPVQCQHVLIEHCSARGASDAGIYVGQCHRVILRHCRAEENVAGIEVENTVGADVYDNLATNNAGGILVFDLPGLQVKAGRDIRVFRNRVLRNNHANFAAPGSIVGSVPPGTGMMILATDRVEVFENEMVGNQTSNLSIVSYHVTGKRVKDPEYDAFPESIYVHDNRMAEGGKNPQGDVATLLRPILGTPFPDILYDGMIDTAKHIDGELPDPLALKIANNPGATFANFNLSRLTPQNVLTGKYQVERDLSAHAGELAPIAAVKLAPLGPPAGTSSRAATVYRAAPRKLSEYGLFQGNGSTQQPVAGVVPYDLNTPLFSDYTTKYRFLRLPPDTQVGYRSGDVLVFPTGTVIAKTFAYPVDMTDSSKGERLLETRIELLEDDGWYGFSYLWNDEQTEATLSLGGSEIDVSWIHSDGQRRTNKYQVPNANQCLNCHSQDKAYVPLGPLAANMNRSFAYPHGDENQLAYLQRLGLLADAPAPETIAKLPNYIDPQTGSVAQRARTWLHVNCAHCHSPQGTARTSGLDLRLGQRDEAKYGVWKAPIAAGKASGDFEYDIVPGEPEKSILLYRLQSEDPTIMMPNVAQRLVPEEAVELIRQWIAEMERK